MSAERAVLAIAWATVADVLTIIAVPLVLQPSRAVRAGLRAAAVAAGAVAVWIIARRAARGVKGPVWTRALLRSPTELELAAALASLVLCAVGVTLAKDAPTPSAALAPTAGASPGDRPADAPATLR